jgi:hypothetical protein
VRELRELRVLKEPQARRERRVLPVLVRKAPLVRKELKAFKVLQVRKELKAFKVLPAPELRVSKVQPAQERKVFKVYSVFKERTERLLRKVRPVRKVFKVRLWKVSYTQLR